MSEAERLEHLEANHHELTQKAGCCGPAGVLMGLLEQRPEEIKKLYKTVTLGTSYRGIPHTTQIKARIAKRIMWDLIDANATTTLDHKLTTGLTIALKEHLAANGHESIWEDCLTYSALFPGWSKGAKLSSLGPPKDDLKTVSAKKDLAFSYKHGDVAMPLVALRKMLDMVGLGLMDQGQLIDNQTVVTAKVSLTTLAGNALLKRNLLELVNLVQDGSYPGAMIGVAKEEFIGVDSLEPYDYVSHWVYLPKQAFEPSLQNIWSTVVWTWGRKLTLQFLLDSIRHYVPKGWVAFRPSTNSYFG